MKNETVWIDRPMGCLLRSRQLSNVFVVLGDMLVCERRVIRRFGHQPAADDDREEREREKKKKREEEEEEEEEEIKIEGTKKKKKEEAGGETDYY